VPAEASLELTKSEWNAGLERWEFSLRCAEPTACVPFLVWTRPPAGGRGLSFTRRAAQPTKPEAGDKELLVKRGQTVILTWDDGGIRVALPVTSLEAGALGQVVRVQLKNVVRILRAEVIGDSIVRASL
jgi:Chaperone for flagella basal body P-ring formation